MRSKPSSPAPPELAAESSEDAPQTPLEAHGGPSRRRQEQHVLEALRLSHAGLHSEVPSQSTREVEQLDSYSLVRAVEAAEDLFVILDEYEGYAAAFDLASANETLADAINALHDVVEAGQSRSEERREHGVHGVRVRIGRGDFARWEITRPRQPGLLSPRPRERRGACARRRGSRRSTGTGSRAGPDDPDLPSPNNGVDRPVEERRLPVAGGRR
jgi:hypothetical protein